MKTRNFLIACSSLVLLAACGQQAEENTTVTEPEVAAEAAVAEEATLEIEIITSGHGRAAEAGDQVTVHYTGWLYDESATDNRGEKFDSSVDRETLSPATIEKLSSPPSGSRSPGRARPGMPPSSRLTKSRLACMGLP